jgi:cystathionine beta-synthase
VRVIGADPVGSIYSGGDIHGYFVEGVGEDFWPSAFDAELPDEIQTVSDAESFDMARRLAREEGMLVGGSSGMAVVAGLRVARAAKAKDVVVILIPDSGRGYLGKVFNDDWMVQQGWMESVPSEAAGSVGSTPPLIHHEHPEPTEGTSSSSSYFYSYEAMRDRYIKYYRTYRLKYKKYIRLTRQTLGL